MANRARARSAIKENVVDDIAARRGSQQTDPALVYQTAFLALTLADFGQNRDLK
jgi:hypothetical protein